MEQCCKTKPILTKEEVDEAMNTLVQLANLVGIPAKRRITPKGILLMPKKTKHPRK